MMCCTRVYKRIDVKWKSIGGFQVSVFINAVRKDTRGNKMSRIVNSLVQGDYMIMISSFKPRQLKGEFSVHINWKLNV